MAKSTPTTAAAVDDASGQSKSAQGTTAVSSKTNSRPFSQRNTVIITALVAVAIAYAVPRAVQVRHRALLHVRNVELLKIRITATGPMQLHSAL